MDYVSGVIDTLSGDGSKSLVKLGDEWGADVGANFSKLGGTTGKDQGECLAGGLVDDVIAGGGLAGKDLGGGGGERGGRGGEEDSEADDLHFEGFEVEGLV